MLSQPFPLLKYNCTFTISKCLACRMYIQLSMQYEQLLLKLLRTAVGRKLSAELSWNAVMNPALNLTDSEVMFQSICCLLLGPDWLGKCVHTWITYLHIIVTREFKSPDVSTIIKYLQYLFYCLHSLSLPGLCILAFHTTIPVFLSLTI